MAKYHQVIGSGSAITADTTHDFTVPGFARHAVFALDLSAVAGTTPTIDVTLQHRDIGGGEFMDVSGGAFAQLTTADTQATLSVGPGLVADAAGSDRTTPAVLPSNMRAVIDIDRTTGDETYTYTLHALYSD